MYPLFKLSLYVHRPEIPVVITMPMMMLRPPCPRLHLRTVQCNTSTYSTRLYANGIDNTFNEAQPPPGGKGIFASHRPATPSEGKELREGPRLNRSSQMKDLSHPPITL